MLTGPKEEEEEEEEPWCQTLLCIPSVMRNLWQVINFKVLTALWSFGV
jgi:hypothetical protein